MPLKIPFNRPYATGAELAHIQQAIDNYQLAGDGAFTRRCQAWLESTTGSRTALLTHSCTAALEMAALLAEVAPGDEVIMPSFTFVSTANAFVLRGATPVFVDVRPDTLNIDERAIEAAITPFTKAIVVVHYAGVGCAMDEIMRVARSRNLLVIEDAAQGMLATYRGRPLGSIGDLGAVSFHETKNVISGEGGALLVNEERFAARAEIVWEKGTNRKQFFRGQVDKYTWVDLGSSFLPGELAAAFLLAQFEAASAITERRLRIWRHYHESFAGIEARGLLRRPVVPVECGHNAHMYYLLLSDIEARNHCLEHLQGQGIGAVFHYVPLHSSPAGQRYGRKHGDLRVTEDVWGRLIRLPLWIGVEAHQGEIVQSVHRALGA